MNMFETGVPLIIDPMVSETWIVDSSQHVRLSNPLLRHHQRFSARQAPEGSLYRKHLAAVGGMFPEVRSARRLPAVWRQDDLVTPAHNIGTVSEAADYVRRGRATGAPMAYITGGLEFTLGQYEAMRYLLWRGYHIIMGHEPYVYPTQKNQRSSAITLSVVPMSFWSKTLGTQGFLFTVPRPYPLMSDNTQLGPFYDGLYKDVTDRAVPIVLSERDPYWREKEERGPVIRVPEFPFPSTTRLWESLSLPPARQN